MNTSAWITFMSLCLAGRNPRVRRHMLYCAATLPLYALYSAVLFHAVYLGQVPVAVAQWLSASMGVTALTFLLLIRTGWSQRFADPVLTLPHAMVSLLLSVMAYVLVGRNRADVIILLAQTIAVSMFRLRPGDCLVVGVWATCWLCVAQMWLVWIGVPDLSAERAWLHFTVAGTALMALSLVGKWISDMRRRVKQQAVELGINLVQAQAMATTDILTGLLNRRCMIDHIEAEIKRASRTGRPLCVALIDLDHFKRINDLHGHRTGDEVLRAFADTAGAHLRRSDRLARWGGEEFLLLMPHIDQSLAWIALERLRARVAGLLFPGQDELTVTVSAGIAQWRPGEPFEPWLERADMAMYAAKNRGRNRCLLADGVNVSPTGAAQTMMFDVLSHAMLPAVHPAPTPS